jgi:TolA-binding protein
MNRLYKFLIITLLLLSVKLLSQQELSADKVFEQVNNSVVVILAYDNIGNVYQGSGVVIDEGFVVTNQHVCKDAGRIEVKHYENEFKNVIVQYSDEQKDIMILRVDGLNLKPISRGNSSGLRSGQRIYAIGSPEGYENSISEGIISGFRTTEGDVKLIQMTTPITEGSSGGAVVNSKGELIGLSVSGQHEGNLYFAVPVNDVYSAIGVTPIVTENEDPTKYYEIGTQANLSQNYRDAELYFSKYIEKFSNDVSAYYSRGYARFKLREYKKAITDFSKVIENNSITSESFFYRGNCYYSINDFQNAYVDYSRALEMEPDNSDLYYNRGYSSLRLGKYQEAVNDWEKAIELNPSYQEELTGKIKVASEQFKKK